MNELALFAGAGGGILGGVLLVDYCPDGLNHRDRRPVLPDVAAHGDPRHADLGGEDHVGLLGELRFRELATARRMGNRGPVCPQLFRRSVRNSVHLKRIE